VSEVYRPSDRRLSVKSVPTFADKWWHVVSVTDSYGRILGFLDPSRYFFFQVTPQLYSRGWVDPVPDPLLPRKSGRAGNRTRTAGSVARNIRPQRWSLFNSKALRSNAFKLPHILRTSLRLTQFSVSVDSKWIKWVTEGPPKYLSPSKAEPFCDVPQMSAKKLSKCKW
jgi:hypothetical protein